jgi:glutathione synthase/RimK-type ligase-like ATP-grasp enzyme
MGPPPAEARRWSCSLPRYEFQGAAYVPVNPPEDVARACVRAVREEGLLLAGFDFRLEPSGRWWCLESNPVPTFLPYEMSTGQPIAAALVDLLGSRERETGAAA